MPARSPGGLQTPGPEQLCTVLGSARRGLPPRGPRETGADPEPASPDGVSPPHPAPARPSGPRHYLDKTSRSSSADSSRSRVLLPPTAAEPPPGRSFSFSPMEEAAMLLTPAAGVCAAVRGRAEAGWGRKEGSRRRGRETRLERRLWPGGWLRAPAPCARLERAAPQTLGMTDSLGTTGRRDTVRVYCAFCSASWNGKLLLNGF